MTKHIHLILFGLIAIIVAMLTAAFFYAFERTEKTVPGAPTGRARTNPYLALEYMFDQFDFTADSYVRLPGFSKFIDEYDPYNAETIFWMTSKHDASPHQIEDLYEWVQTGGHLLVVAPTDKNDLLVDTFDLKLNKNFTKYLDASDEISPQKTYNFDTQNTQFLLWNNPDADHKFFDSDKNLLALSQPFGLGRLTFFIAATPFTNRQIGKKDHAQLALDLAQLHLGNAQFSNDPNVMPSISIIQHGQRTSWVMHVLTRFWPLAATLLILLCIALMQGFRRFGPLEVIHASGPSSNSNSRRSRLEHIHAVGRFLWKNDAQQTLLEATRNALLEKLARRRPAIKSLRGNALYSIIAEELDISPEEARQLFDWPVSTRPNQFLDSIRTLENFRRNL